MQIVDEQDGPLTKRDYDITMVPVGENLVGKCTDFLGRPLGSSTQAGQGPRLPLFNEQVAVEDREQIHEAMLTGVKVRTCILTCGWSLRHSVAIGADSSQWSRLWMS